MPQLSFFESRNTAKPASANRVIVIQGAFLEASLSKCLPRRSARPNVLHPPLPCLRCFDLLATSFILAGVCCGLSTGQGKVQKQALIDSPSKREIIL